MDTLRLKLSIQVNGLKCAYLRFNLMNFKFKDVYLALRVK